MKTISKLALLFFLGLSISCSSDSTDDLPQTINPSNVQNIASTSSWRITSYLDNNKNETSDYTGYVFTFNANGSATAVKNSQTTNGIWSSYLDDGKVKFDINFGVTAPLEEISDDWDVLEITANKIRLEDTSGDGTKDFLTFEKN
jgi:hypothetical protein